LLAGQELEGNSAGSIADRLTYKHSIDHILDVLTRVRLPLGEKVSPKLVIRDFYHMCLGFLVLFFIAHIHLSYFCNKKNIFLTCHLILVFVENL